MRDIAILRNDLKEDPTRYRAQKRAMKLDDWTRRQPPMPPPRR